jgi:hypothetical protein
MSRAKIGILNEITNDSASVKGGSTLSITRSNRGGYSCACSVALMSFSCSYDRGGRDRFFRHPEFIVSARQSLPLDVV